MSYFQSRPARYRKLTQKQLDIKRMHWTKYLDKYPLSKEPVWENVEGDYNNRLDNWDDPENEETMK